MRVRITQTAVWYPRYPRQRDGGNENRGRESTYRTNAKEVRRGQSRDMPRVRMKTILQSSCFAEVGCTHALDVRRNLAYVVRYL